jgi:hypothetical protein
MRSLRSNPKAALAALIAAGLLAGCATAAAGGPRRDPSTTVIDARNPVSIVPLSLRGHAASVAGRRRTSHEPPVTTTTSVVQVGSSPPAGSPPPPAAGLVSGRVTVIGDSVTIDAAPALEALIPGVQVDAQVGEQWETGIGVLQQLRSSGQLGAVVVVALGTNGPVSVGEFQQMLATLQGVSRVVIVTDHAPDYWEEQNNAMFKSEVPHYANARIADWDALASQHPDWLYSDGTHMPIGGPGAHGWAELVKAQI